MERMDSTRLELFKNKEEHAQSANASQEVRKHLAGFIRSKQLQGSGNQSSNATNNNNNSTQLSSTITSSGGNIPASVSSFQPCTSRQSSTTSSNNNNSLGPGCILPTPHDHDHHQHHHHLVESIMADDHPLRKTASMPTMHIPYKAQSSSRRRQMERRTTMSPLMKRKSKPRRQLLQSQDSNSTEYLSSNPCMTTTLNQSHQLYQNHVDVARSLSQSNSPPPVARQSLMSYYYHHQQQQQQTSFQPASGSGINSVIDPIGGVNQFTSQSQIANHVVQAHKVAETSMSSCEQAPKLSFMINNIRELENLRNNIGDSSYFSSHNSSATGGGACSSSSNGNKPLDDHQHQQQLQQASSSANILHQFNSGTTSIIDNFTLQNHQSPSSSSPVIRGDSLDNNQIMRQQQQQHSKVTEAIKIRMQRASSSRGRMTVGGSLDIDAPPSAAGNSRASGSRDSAATRRGNNFANYKDELRQWSLDGADLRTNGMLGRSQQTGGGGPSSSSLMTTNLINRDIYKLRMATTNDAASLRRSQSPSASILSGGNQVGALHQQHQTQQRGMQGKLYSSSSSSTSSLLSQQDSLDDSSSQAIDLSSSSEASRNRSTYHQHKQQQASHQLTYAASGGRGAPENTSQHQAVNVAQQYQKMLHESLSSQIQLSQHHQPATNYKKLLMNTAQHQSVDVAGVRPNMAAAAHHPPSLLNASRAATSLDDNAYGGSNVNLLTSLADQFNLSTSAQNLILAQVDGQQQFACLNTSPMLVDHSHQLSSNQQQHQPSAQDHNQWLLAYNSLLQTDLQKANQITSSLLDKIPEPYKSNIWSHLVSQHRQQFQPQQQQRRNLQSALAGGAGSGNARIDGKLIHREDQRSLINRTLSSPLLVSSTTTNNSSGKRPDFPPAAHLLLLQQQQQGSVGQLAASNEMADKQKDRTQQATVMMQLDTLQLTDKKKKLEAAGSGGSPSVITDNSSGGGGACADNNSIDLTLSSGRSANNSSSTDTNHNKPKSDSSGGTSDQLNFSYTPMDPERAKYSFIYNPVFDEHSSTGLVYELEMCNHKCICLNENNHPENSQRILAIWRRIYDRGLMAKCARIHSRKATFDEIQLCHSETYSYYFGKSPYERIKINRLDLSKLPIEGLTQLECGGQGADIDTVWNEEQTPGVARLAAGCVIEAALSVAKGHHAEFQQAMGFCFFNSVAIAAKVLIQRQQLARLLIVDWDVHHGNGTQRMFYHDQSVMYISLHRHDRGNFFPGTGDAREIGLGAGEGYNWNVAWSSETMGDAEYVAAFRSIVMPIARDFNPSMVLVACGFDAAQGHPFNFGGYDLSAACFAYMTRQLMTLANGRLVLCLEGGYQIAAICDCAEACLRALLNEKTNSSSGAAPTGGAGEQQHLRESELRREPNHSACEVLYELSSLAAKYWPGVEKWRHTIELSALDAASSTGVR